MITENLTRNELKSIMLCLSHHYGYFMERAAGPQQGADFALPWRLIKSAFSRRLMQGERISAAVSVR
jgi:hypothetical protein